MIRTPPLPREEGFQHSGASGEQGVTPGRSIGLCHCTTMLVSLGQVRRLFVLAQLATRCDKPLLRPLRQVRARDPGIARQPAHRWTLRKDM